ncbi:MAG: sulfite exporter TauE/SafE family protein [Bacteriovoracaceae bacterium]|nr:sulfite exporter TauE/SafE family protein [Bacteriovoracaceae bacterium]
MLLIFTVFLFIGLFSGFLAGLFGVGGGIILVPSLLISFKYFNFPQDYLMHSVLATSLSCIIITSLNSSYTHLQKTSLDKPVFLNITLGITLGASSGGFVVKFLTSHQLQIFFVLFLLLVTYKMFKGFNLPAEQRHIPKPIYWFMGFIIGLKSALLGVGGGTLSVPLLNWTGKKMQDAVAISSTIGIPISLIGTIAYIISGWNISDLPDYSLGYVYLPAFASISLATTFSSRFGANLSHRLSHEKLKFVFKYFLLIILTKSIYNII